MKDIAKDMTTEQFLVVVNQNFSELEQATSESYDDIISTDDIVEKVNEYFEETVINYGDTGLEIKDKMKNEFINNDLVYDPSDVVLTWIDDYLQILFTANSNVEHEIYESVNDGEYTLVETLDAGVEYYNNYTDQNANVKIKIRAKNGSIYSGYSEVEEYDTPWVFRMNQQTLTEVNWIIGLLGEYENGIVIDWDDGTETIVDVDEPGTIVKNYETTGNYFVKITGDLNNISGLRLEDQAYQLAGTVVTKWNLPTLLVFVHLYFNGLIGNITRMHKSLPTGLLGLHFGGNSVTLDISQIVWPAAYWDMHIYSDLTDKEGEGVYGEITNMELPDTIAHFNIQGYIYGDMTTVIPWVNTTYGTIILRLLSTHPTGLVGDLSGWTIPDKPAGLTANTGCHFTKLPRGNFRKVSPYDFRNNNCNAQEIDDILTYIDNYFSGEIVPTMNCDYTLNGTGMGTPTATGLAARTSILNKYIAAGLTATIYVNS